MLENHKKMLLKAVVVLVVLVFFSWSVEAKLKGDDCEGKYFLVIFILLRFYLHFISWLA